jgi:hypothetical protein
MTTLARALRTVARDALALPLATGVSNLQQKKLRKKLLFFKNIRST